MKERKETKPASTELSSVCEGILPYIQTGQSDQTCHTANERSWSVNALLEQAEVTEHAIQITIAHAP